MSYEYMVTYIHITSISMFLIRFMYVMYGSVPDGQIISNININEFVRVVEDEAILFVVL